MMTALRDRTLILAFGLALLVLVLDQASKLLVLDALLAEPRVIEVTSFLNFVLAWNRGVSFGMFSDADIGPWIFFAIAVIFSIVMAVWIVRTDVPLLRIALGLLIGGAIGNAIDRVLYGAVVDFLDVHALGWHFWTFNVADAAITVGAILLVADSLFRRPT